MGKILIGKTSDIPSGKMVMVSADVFFGDPTRPIGGNVVAHTSTYRIYFKKSGKKRIARMVDSPHHPEQDVIFALGDAGVIDPDSDTKKKSTKTAKSSKGESIEPEVKVEPKSDSSVDVDSKTEDIPKVKVELKTDSVDVDAKIEDIPKDSE